MDFWPEGQEFVSMMIHCLVPCAFVTVNKSLPAQWK